MAQQKHQESPGEKAYYEAIDKALDKLHQARAPIWDKCYRAREEAWKVYEMEMVPYERICNLEISEATRAYPGAKYNNESMESSRV